MANGEVSDERDLSSIGGDIFHNYLQYTADTEPPTIYHRWSYLTTLGAIIGRRAYINHGHFRVFPTLYVMLIGEPATRKSTSIKMVKKLVAASGYDTFAFDKTSKEKFLEDLASGGIDEDQLLEGKKGTKYDTITADNLWGSTGGTEPKEIYIVADEFNEFAGTGNLEFYTTLGNMWDFDSPEQPFTQRFKNSRSVSIYQPTISLLAGNTPELFARAFPPEAIGSGFLSRLLLIHGERSGRKITFPPPPDPILGASLITYLRKLKEVTPGRLDVTDGALSILNDIYQIDVPVIDIRFKAYDNRRFTQLLKMCVIFACAKFQKEVTEEDVIQANTILSHAEILMPKALGEFGKNKNSDVANKVMDVIERVNAPISTKQIWIQVHKDLATQKDLVELLHGLVAADKLQIVTPTRSSAAGGYLPKKIPRIEPKFVDWNFLTQEERNMI